MKTKIRREPTFDWFIKHLFKLIPKLYYLTILMMSLIAFIPNLLPLQIMIWRLCLRCLSQSFIDFHTSIIYHSPYYLIIHCSFSLIICFFAKSVYVWILKLMRLYYMLYFIALQNACIITIIKTSIDNFFGSSLYSIVSHIQSAKM